MGTMNEVVPTSEQELINFVAGTYMTILKTSRDILRLKFELGRLVGIHLKRHKHQHAAIIRLAQSISGICGKSIVPQRLYEAARYYETFGGQLERVWAFERRLSQPLTYTYLIRSIIPRVQKNTAWNTEEWALYQEAQIGRLELAVQEIESLREIRVKEELPPDRSVAVVERAEPADVVEPGSMPVPVEGLLEICRESTGYQCFRVSTLVSTIVQACKQLEAIDGLVLEEDRLRLQGVLPIITKCIASVREEVAA